MLVNINCLHKFKRTGGERCLLKVVGLYDTILPEDF